MKLIKRAVNALKRSWTFTRFSSGFLYRHKTLLLFPICCYLCWFFVYLILAAIVSYYAQKIHLGFLLVAVVLAGYFLLCLVLAFFNAALLHYAADSLHERQASLKRSLFASFKRIHTLFVWCMLNSTFGLVMYIVDLFDDSLSEEILTVPWSIYSYFAMPMILFADMSLIAALRRCRELFSEHKWRHVGTINIFFVALPPIILWLIFYICTHLTAGNTMLSLIVSHIAVLTLTVCIIVLAVLYPAMLGIIKTLLYQKAMHDAQPVLPTHEDILRQALTER